MLAENKPGDPKGRPLIAAELLGGAGNISELQARVAVATAPNQSSQAGSIEPPSRDQLPIYIR
jgi:hypothetical protein